MVWPDCPALSGLELGRYSSLLPEVCSRTSQMKGLCRVLPSTEELGGLVGSS